MAVNAWEKNKYSSSKDRLDKLWLLHTMRFYAATKRNEDYFNRLLWGEPPNTTLRKHGRKSVFSVHPFIQERRECTGTHTHSLFFIGEITKTSLE